MTAWTEYDAGICTDCLQTSANGWDDNQPLPDPVPLALVPAGTLIGWGEDLEAHFSWLRCDTCGCTLGGDRFDVSVSEPADPLAGVCLECGAPVALPDTLCGGCASQYVSEPVTAP